MKIEAEPLFLFGSHKAMKHWLVILLIWALPNVAGATNNLGDSTAVLQFKESKHGFGKISQGRPVYYSFEFKNVGNKAVKLDDVHASCGCTTPQWNKELIQPGASSLIKVGFNAASEGDFEKTIIVTYNSNQTEVLTISGKVWKTPQSPAPANSSLELLKQQTL